MGSVEAATAAGPPSTRALRASTSSSFVPATAAFADLGRGLSPEDRLHERVLGAQLLEGQLELVGEGGLLEVVVDRGRRVAGGSSERARGSSRCTPRAAARSASSPPPRTGRCCRRCPAAATPPKPTRTRSITRGDGLLLAAAIVAQGSPIACASAGSAATFARSCVLLLRLRAPSPSRRGARLEPPVSAFCAFSKPKIWALARRSCSSPRARVPAQRRQPALEQRRGVNGRPPRAEVLELRHRVEARRRAGVARDEHELAVARPPSPRTAGTPPASRAGRSRRPASGRCRGRGGGR